MNLYVIVDNNTIIDKYYKGEPALSFYIEDNDCKILFDTGYSDIFLENARKMGINLCDIDCIVLSHGHNDHTCGLQYLMNFEFNKKVKIFAHPLTFNKKIDADGPEIGCPVSIDDLNKKFELVLTDKPHNLSPTIKFLGEIPRTLDKSTVAVDKIIINNKMVPDFHLDDSALVVTNNNRISIITGCSHSGLINIVDYALKISETKDLKNIIGGFHLLDNTPTKAEEISKFLLSKNVKKITPCHCTNLLAKCVFSKYFDVQEIGVGSCVEI
jgi:7,8-dihydropterin-6-yl-methyl-4-(beta-D-ribofuranosyl)aminobenzene 5'-phosphate synthase